MPKKAAVELYWFLIGLALAGVLIFIIVKHVLIPLLSVSPIS